MRTEAWSRSCRSRRGLRANLEVGTPGSIPRCPLKIEKSLESADHHRDMAHHEIKWRSPQTGGSKPHRNGRCGGQKIKQRLADESRLKHCSLVPKPGARHEEQRQPSGTGPTQEFVRNKLPELDDAPAGRKVAPFDRLHRAGGHAHSPPEFLTRQR